MKFPCQFHNVLVVSCPLFVVSTVNHLLKAESSKLEAERSCTFYVIRSTFVKWNGVLICWQLATNNGQLTTNLLLLNNLAMRIHLFFLLFLEISFLVDQYKDDTHRDRRISNIKNGPEKNKFLA